MIVKVLRIMISAFLASFGALVRFFNQKTVSAMKVTNMISGCFIAAFAGVLVQFFSEHYVLNQNIAYIIAGISGWLGPQVLDMLAAIVMKNCQK